MGKFSRTTLLFGSGAIAGIAGTHCLANEKISFGLPHCQIAHYRIANDQVTSDREDNQNKTVLNDASLLNAAKVANISKCHVG